MVPWNIAHRGGAQLRPENTLSAFADAVWRGCQGAELDVQLTADGQVIVHHDWRLKPALTRDFEGRWIADPGPRIKDLTLEELRRYEVGRADPDSIYAKSHPDVHWQDGECVPLLSEVIAVARTARDPFKLIVELKTSFANREESADPEELAARTVEVLGEHNYLDHTIFVGFDWAALIAAKKYASKTECWFTSMPLSWFGHDAPPPEADPPSEQALQMLRYWAREGVSPWAAGFDAVHHGGSIIRAVKEAGGDGWDPMWVDLTEETVGEARGLGLRLATWTVNEPNLMRKMASLGLDAIYTDRPDMLAAVDSY
ncbi:glycerophosphoryl diester phosphodiesterase [Rhizomicrobium palustre]|uniref:Glycerophosphoryl diester phosphodiesterase n=1 Tax=Rhizomicrobium palustre TaxID=189966 RepID=A0A846N3R9_9PROT|nr:glycerophosphodiester phosphodiesterase family protein [Rhizomicrobium palustre]NIK90376.1 glycerophosphoryl diester phosphodiesterase [Rhizomicrobium palustre]